MTIFASFDYDFGYLQGGLEELERYLLSEEVYWPLSVRPPKGSPPYPRLTLGWMLLMRLRCQGYALSPRRTWDLERVVTQLEAVRDRWRVAWEKKAAREFHSRLGLWKNFLSDYHRRRADHTDRYPYEVQRRVMLSLLSAEARTLPEESLQVLEALDGLLRASFQSGDFVWSTELASAFPKERYWYLYGSLRSY